MAYLESQRPKCTVSIEWARGIDGGVHGAGAENTEWSGQGKFLV